MASIKPGVIQSAEAMVETALYNPMLGSQITVFT